MKNSLLFLLLILGNLSFSQTVSHKSDSTYKENSLIITNIESTYNIAFFYKTEWLKNIKLNKADNFTSLDSALLITFKNTGLKYYQYQTNYIILTKEEDLNLADNHDLLNTNTEVKYAQSEDVIPRDELAEEERRIRIIGSPGGNGKRVQGQVPY